MMLAYGGKQKFRGQKTVCQSEGDGDGAGLWQHWFKCLALKQGGILMLLKFRRGYNRVSHFGILTLLGGHLLQTCPTRSSGGHLFHKVSPLRPR